MKDEYKIRVRTHQEEKFVSRSASSDQLFQSLGIHPRKPGHKPALEWKWMSTQRISPTYGMEHRTDVCTTHIIFPPENLASTGISTPFSSSGLSILNTANTLAMTDHTDVSAKCLPTHMRRPNPNAICSTSFGFSEPSPLRNRSGMNVCELGYLDSSRAMALENVGHQDLFQKSVEYTDHRLATIIAP